MTTKPENRKPNKKKQLPAAAEPYKWKPGQSGNPGGRPKKTLLTEAMEELLEEKLQDPEARKQFKEAMWAKLLSGKVVGSMTLDTVLERTEGKIAQPVKMEGNLTISLADAIKEARERAANA